MNQEKCPIIQDKTQEEEIQICLNCPFPQCVLEIPWSCPAKEIRNILIRELAQQGKSKRELANIFGLSLRATQRILQKEVD